MKKQKTIKVNFIDFYGSFNPQSNIYTKILQKHYNVQISDHPDFLFYSCFGVRHQQYDCTKIFVTDENIIPNFNECDYANGFDYIDFGDRYIRHNFSLPSPEINDRTTINENYVDRLFCNFIYSNSNSGEGTSTRQEFCKKLMQYKHIDCPGKVLNNMTAPDLAPRNGSWRTSKINFLKKYKFTIAFENSCSNGYTTEKLLHPFLGFSIPIYWGNPLVTRDYNPKAFINCNDYNNDFDAVINRVKELDNDPEQYLAMLREKPMQPDFNFNHLQKFEQWLVNIIEKGNHPFNKDPRDWQGSAYRETIKTLQQENFQIRTENQKLRETLAKHKKTTTGNWLYKTVENANNIKTYILGIRFYKHKKQQKP